MVFAIRLVIVADGRTGANRNFSGCSEAVGERQRNDRGPHRGHCSGWENGGQPQQRSTVAMVLIVHCSGWENGGQPQRGRRGACFRLPGAPKTVSLAKQPAPVPNSESAAIALRSPYCSANAPRTPQRTPRPHNLPHTRPIRSPIPRKKRHFPAPPVPGPAPSNPTHALPILTTAPFLPTNPPQFRNFANPLETPVHPCYPRPSEGPTPRPGNPTPHTG